MNISPSPGVPAHIKLSSPTIILKTRALFGIVKIFQINNYLSCNNDKRGENITVNQRGEGDDI